MDNYLNGLFNWTVDSSKSNSHNPTPQKAIIDNKLSQKN